MRQVLLQRHDHLGSGGKFAASSLPMAHRADLMEHDLEGKLASVRPTADGTAYAIQECHLVACQTRPDAPMVRSVDVACIAGVLRPQAHLARASQDIRIELAGHVIDIDQLIGLAGAMWPGKRGKLV